MENIYRDIYRLKNCKVFRKIEEGWSSDTKYYVEDESGQKLVLRTADISVYEDKFLEYQMIQLFSQLDFTMSLAIDFGTCKGGKLVYMLLTYVEGQSLDICIANLPEARQYELGLQAGKILKQIHSLTCDASHDKQHKIKKMLDKIKRYESCQYKIPHDEVAITYIHENIHKLASLPTVFNHGDFHVGNLILTPQGTLGVIDFNRWRQSDYCEEFYKVQSFDIEKSIPFSRGQIDGYFDKEVPQEFWEVLAVYCAYAALGSIVWAIQFGEEDIVGMIKRAVKTLSDYDDFEKIIPSWYQEEVDV